MSGQSPPITFGEAVNQSIASAGRMLLTTWREVTPEGRLVAAAKAMNDDRLLAWVMAAPMGSAADRPTVAHPDAELIRACESLAGALDAYAASEGSDREAAAEDAYGAVRNAIDDVRPQTLTGMVAKARAAIRHASEQPGLDVVRGERSTVAEGWAWDLLHDLLRLHGADDPAVVTPRETAP